MNKIFFQDVVPPDRRSIRDVPIMNSRNKKTVSVPVPLIINEEKPEKEAELSQEETIKGNYSYPSYPTSSKKSPSMKIFGTVAILLVGGFIFTMMTVFTSAQIDITPKRETISFNSTLKALKNPIVGEDAPRFEMIEITKEDSLEVPASGEEMAEKKASGSIIIYNNFSEEPQRLITNTRFETPEGFIYRITESVTVPGKGTSAPGFIESIVFADDAGQKYNIGKTDFTIPGFKSDSLRYKGFYAKSKTGMTGGFVGKIKKVSENDKKNAASKLQESLKKELEKDITAKVPDGLVYVKGGALFEFKDLGQTDSSGSIATVKMEGKANVVVFDKNSLASVLAKEFIPGWANMPVEIKSYDEMIIAIDQGFNILADSLLFRLTGKVDVFAVSNAVEIANALKGKPKNSLNKIMASFKGVSGARAVIRPMWKTSFPEDTAKIHINIE